MSPSAIIVHPPDDVAALVAVTDCDVTHDNPHGALTHLTGAAVAALGAGAGGVWVLDEHHGAPRVVGTVRIPADTPPELAGSVATLLRTGARTVPLGTRTLPEALARAGARHGLAFPVPASAGVVAALVVGGGAPPHEGALRHHAARVAAGRIGALLDGIRLRENLERAMAQILETDERMLGRIGLDIHDGPTQQLSVALLEVQLLQAELDDAAAAGAEVSATVRDGLGRIYETLGGALHEMRELIGHLRPAQFDDRRLSDILQDAVTGFRQRSDAEVSTRFEGEFPVNGVSITQRITFYRILQETLTNAHRHGRAGHIDVIAREGPAGVTLQVRDDGLGFDAHALARTTPGMPLVRFGLHGMRDRAQVLGGSFTIWSEPGRGTHVRVFLPRWRPAEEAADAA